MSKLAVIFGAGSKWDKDGSASDMDPHTRFGLGGALSLTFGAAGYHCVLVGRRQPILDSVVAMIQDAGGEATAIVGDVTNDDSVKAVFEAASAIGTLDVVIFNVSREREVQLLSCIIAS